MHPTIHIKETQTGSMTFKREVRRQIGSATSVLGNALNQLLDPTRALLGEVVQTIPTLARWRKPLKDVTDDQRVYTLICKGNSLTQSCDIYEATTALRHAVIGRVKYLVLTDIAQTSHAIAKGMETTILCKPRDVLKHDGRRPDFLHESQEFEQ
jgi:hypothetical protein